MRALMVLGLALAACASSNQRPTQPWDTAKPTAATPAPAPTAGSTGAAAPAAAAPAPAPQRPEPARADAPQLLETNPTAWAARFRKGAECEAAAREARTISSNSAWRALRACAARGDFKALTRLTDGFWDADLQTRPDAAPLLGAVLAARGADLATDLPMLRKRRVPFFSLGTATNQPEVFKGRAVVFAARVEEVKKGAKGKAVAVLSELTMVSQNTGTSTVARYSESSRMDEHGRGYRTKDSYLGNETKTHYTNGLDDTGVEVKGTLTRLDPFFEPGATFLLVARFDGMTESKDAPSGEQPAVTVLAYYTVGAESFLD
jgi:hypothetical protein